MDFFLDANILFECIISSKVKSQIKHILNTGNRSVSSITVLGETIAICIGEKRTNDLDNIIDLNHELKLLYHFPTHKLRECCACLDRIDPTDFCSVTDKTHLAFAIVNNADYFVTMDNALLKFPIEKCKCKEKCEWGTIKGIITTKQLLTIIKSTRPRLNKRKNLK